MDVMHERVMSLIPERRGGVKEFAEKVGVPANLVSMWRNGDSFSYKNYLSKISSAYNVSVDWLCGHSEQKETPILTKEDKRSEIDIIFSQLTPSNQTKLLELARLYLDDQRKREETK